MNDDGNSQKMIIGHIEALTPTAENAALLAGHPVTKTERAIRHGERYTGDFTPHNHPPFGGWYGVSGVADCGHPYTNVESDEPEVFEGPAATVTLAFDARVSITTGYGVDRDTDLSMCDDCIQARTLAQMDAGETIHGYVSSDGQYLTTWLGKPLARVWEHGHRDGSGIHTWTFHQQGVFMFYGRNAGPGMCITVRPRKSNPTRIDAVVSWAELISDVTSSGPRYRLHTSEGAYTTQSGGSVGYVLNNGTNKNFPEKYILDTPITLLVNKSGTVTGVMKGRKVLS